MTDYSLYPCPSGYYCLNGEDPHLCPAGRMRNTTGAGASSDCPLCREGYYCPNDTVNMHGIPCPERYYCEEGAGLPTDCEPGYFCPSETGVAPICPAGYYCPDLSLNPIACLTPYYCPEGSNMTLICPLGFQALDNTGIRSSEEDSCVICQMGSYGNYSDRSQCESCPPGYYCPAGTGHGDSYPCTAGSYCEQGSHEMTSCPLGYYGTKDIATSESDCTACEGGTYSNTYFSTSCHRCGGTSKNNKAGSSTCECKGKHRYFQETSGACVCKGGYIFYDETDRLQTTDDGSKDCQRRSFARCSKHQTYLASTGGCVDPDSYDCSNMGGCSDSAKFKRGR